MASDRPATPAPRPEEGEACPRCGLPDSTPSVNGTGVCHGTGDCVASLRAALTAERAAHAETRRAMAAADQRLRAAEERIWPGATWGCDAAEELADAVLAERARAERAEAEVARLRGALETYAADNNWLPELNGRRVVLDCDGNFGGEVARRALAPAPEGA